MLGHGRARARARRLPRGAARLRRGARVAPHQARARSPEEGRRAAAARRWSSSALPDEDERGAQDRRAGDGRGVREGPAREGHRRARRARASRARSAATTSTAGPVIHGSHNVRAPGSIGASATPVARLQGHADARPDGQPARHPARPRGGRRRRRAQPADRAGAPSRARRARSSRSSEQRDEPAMQHKAPKLGAQGTCGPARRRSSPSPSTRRRLRGRARRAARAPPRHRRHQDARRGARRRRQALAPEGHRPCARRLDPRAALDRRRRRLRPHARAATP